MIGASTVICGARPAFALIANSPALAREDRVLQHRLVEFKADLADVARLFVAQQIARAANVEIVAGELEPCAKAVEIAQHLQPLLAQFA